MTPIEFWYEAGREEPRTAATPEQVDAELDRAIAWGGDEAVALQVARDGDGGGVLMVGFNGAVGVLHHLAGDADHFSQGESASGEEPLVYGWQQHEYLFPANAEIPVGAVRAAVHEYARSGERPTGVRWQRWEPPVEATGLDHDPFDPAVWG